MKKLILLIAVFHLAGAETPIHIRSAVAACRAGQAALSKHDLALAVDQFQQAIHVEPTFVEAYEGLINAYLASKRSLDAAHAITRFLEIEPQLTPYRLILAQLLQQNRDLNRALAQFTIVLKTDPQNADALFGFATTAEALGLHDRATQATEAGRTKHPGDKRFR